MPTSTSSQSLLASLPSFMSVFGEGPDRIAINEGNSTSAHSPIKTHTKRLSSFSTSFTRRDSASTFESTESSPTTTISTMESSLTEPSPQSPPESPDSSLPTSSFKCLRTQSVPGPGTMGDSDRKDHFSSSFPIFPGVDRAESPNKKMRNMKNLSVNTSAASRQGSQFPKVGLSNQSGGSHAFSAPPTPAFIVPPKPPRKKPSTLGLTITTPDVSTTNQASPERPNVVAPIQSDHQIRTLRALQTSTNGPLFSPTVAPEGGMRLPPFSTPASSSRCSKTRPPLSVPTQVTLDSTSPSPISRQTLDHVQEETDYEVPLSQEQKSPAYPQGPVCIYDPYVYLYLEPSHLEALEFDVVLNVAREVKNPFTISEGQAECVPKEEEGDRRDPKSEIHLHAGREGVSDSQTNFPIGPPTSEAKRKAEVDTEKVASTPKAKQSSPEYIHIPWDHNTNVVDDLLRLCELIDNRIRQEKRLLVHCQCGVSRSASLVVAFGLYKNPHMTVQEAYDAVKNRSRWIGPNMNLIYQLSEFKTRLLKDRLTGTSAWHSWRNNLGSGRPESKSLLSPDRPSGLVSSTPRNAPQKSLSTPSDLGRDPAGGRPSPLDRPASARLLHSSSAGDITPGPSSAPPGMHFSRSDDTAEGKPQGGSLKVDPTLATSMMDLDADMTLSPSQTVNQRENPPLGGVAKDLEEVAKDLDMNDHNSVSLPRFKTTDTKDEANNPAIVAYNELRKEEFEEPVSPRTISPSSASTVRNGTSPLTIETSQPQNNEPPLPAPNLPNPSPTLPAGFSSLSFRRQAPLGLRQLPIRPLSPPPIADPLPQKAVDPDVPPTPSLLSPRAAEFTASPFHRTVAGDLAGSSVFEQGLMSPKARDEDPRSPTQRGEAPITRSIFDMI